MITPARREVFWLLIENLNPILFIIYAFICIYLYRGVTRLETHKALNFNEDRLYLKMDKIEIIV